jgi:FkbM family methyltransferase
MAAILPLPATTAVQRSVLFFELRHGRRWLDESTELPDNPRYMTIFANISRPCRQLYHKWARKPDRYLHYAKGVVHVGANSGQERDIYDLFDLPVFWIEPIEDVFHELQSNIAGFPKQQAVQALVTDENGRDYEFHIANNAGQSSSIFNLKQHSDIWPEVTMEKTVTLQSRTLDTLVEQQQLATGDFDTLVMDTQGSELLVLKGAKELLQGIRFIKTEAADFAAYEGCCRVDDLSAWLEPLGFVEEGRVRIASRDEGGSYYDIVYRKSG